MIKVKFEDGEVKIECTLKGRCGEYTSYGILDSGFSSFVAAPLSAAMQLGLEPAGEGSVRLADGSLVSLPVYVGKVQIGNDSYECPFLIVQSDDILLGMSLMKNYKVCFSAKENSVQITGFTSEKGEALSQLWKSLSTLVPS